VTSTRTAPFAGCAAATVAHKAMSALAARSILTGERITSFPILIRKTRHVRRAARRGEVHGPYCFCRGCTTRPARNGERNWSPTFFESASATRVELEPATGSERDLRAELHEPAIIDLIREPVRGAEL
jgi:hypothetical protein